MLEKIIPNKKPYCTIKQQPQPKIKRVLGSYKDIRMDFLTVGFWVSSMLATILAVPAIGVFVYFLTVLLQTNAVAVQCPVRTMGRFWVWSDVVRVVARVLCMFQALCTECS